MCFKKSVQIVRALKLNGADFQGRPLRIQKWESKDAIHKKEKKTRNKKKPSSGGGKQLDLRHPTNNPQLRKIKAKIGKVETIQKAEFKKKFREKFQGGKQEVKKKKSDFHGVKSDAKMGKHKKKKAATQQKIKKIAKILTGSNKR